MNKAMHPLQLIIRKVQQTSALGALRQVTNPWITGATGGRTFSHGTVHSVRIDIGKYGVNAFMNQCLGNRPANTIAGTRHNRRLAIKEFHIYSILD